MSVLPVVAAIANYNMAEELERLLPQVVEQGYDAIFVLDDASTDNSQEVVQRFKSVTLVAGDRNKGAGGNRNRIIKALKYDALIHFLDADVELETHNTAELVRTVTPDGPFAFVGGLIKTKAGQPHPWNFGNGAGLKASFGAWIQQQTFDQRSGLSRFVRRIFRKTLSGYPEPQTTPKRREIYWCAEANMVVRSDIFASLGGFNEVYRETDILELAIHAYRRGLKSYFDPRLSVRHTEGNVRRYNRDLRKLKEMLRISWGLGLADWLISDGKAKMKRGEPYRVTPLEGKRSKA